MWRGGNKRNYGSGYVGTVIKQSTNYNHTPKVINSKKTRTFDRVVMKKCSTLEQFQHNRIHNLKSIKVININTYDIIQKYTEY